MKGSMSKLLSTPSAIKLTGRLAAIEKSVLGRHVGALHHCGHQDRDRKATKVQSK